MRVLFHPGWRQVGSTRRLRCASHELIHDRARARLALIAPLRPSLLSAAAWGLAAVTRTLFVRNDWDHALVVVLPIVAAINSVLVTLPKARQRTTFDLERKRVRIGWRWFAFSEVRITASSRDSARSQPAGTSDETATISPYRAFSLEAQTPEGPRLLMRFDADTGEVEPLAASGGPCASRAVRTAGLHTPGAVSDLT